MFPLYCGRSACEACGWERGDGEREGVTYRIPKFIVIRVLEFFLPDTDLLENEKKYAGSKLPLAEYRDGPPFLFVPVMNMADALFTGR